jgi:hypothetical protein
MGDAILDERYGWVKPSIVDGAEFSMLAAFDVQVVT